MKKILAIMLALVLVLANVAAMAEDGLPDISDIIEKTAGNETTGTTPNITKKYTTSGTADDVFPTETLKFKVTKADDSYPTITIGTNNTFTTNGQASYDIPLTIPGASEYGAVGKYHYTIQEDDPETQSQGVEYDTTTVFNVDVYITYTKNADGTYSTDLSQYIVVYSGDDPADSSSTTTNKTDEIDNTYSVGSLTVDKTVTGSLGDTTKKFEIEVTLTSALPVNSALTISPTPKSDNVTDLGWTSRTLKFELANGESFTIEDIPAGVTYTIAENTTHLADNEAATQMAAANDPNAYYVTGEVKAGETKESGTISTTAATESITNNKDINVPTGISLESAPYMLIMMIALAGAAMLVSKKRRSF